MLYRNNLKNREFDKEAFQNCDPEQMTIAVRQGVSEDQNFEKEPTQSKTVSLSFFDIYQNNLKNREFDKEAFQNCDPEQMTIAARQGVSEDQNFEKEPTQSKTVSLSGYRNNVLLFLFFLCCTHKLTALYNGNPSLPMMPEQGIFFTHSWVALKAGYEFDHVYDHNLKMHSHHLHANHHKYASSAQFGVLTLDLSDRVEFFSALGSMRSKLSQHVQGNDIHYHTDKHFAWSLGGRTLFAYWGNIQFGLEASYLHFFPPIQSISVNGSSFARDDAELEYHEWQVGATISYHFWWLFPYIGTKYSNVKAEFKHLQSLQFLFPKKDFTLNNAGQLGLVIGCGLSPERGFDINVEGRFIDETAFTVSADVRF